MNRSEVPKARVPKPDWLKVKLAHGESYELLKSKVKTLDLHTVCQEAMCPNIGECWGAGTATIMILGDTCTRGCRFCNVKTGIPKGIVDWMEPVRVADAVRDLGWKYLLLTAVDRDDLAGSPWEASNSAVLISSLPSFLPAQAISRTR